MKLPVYSYTFLNTYDICPKQAFHRYVLKDHPFVGSEASKWGNVVHDALDKRLSKGEPLPKEVAKYEVYAKVLEPLRPNTEWKLGIKRDGDACAFFDDAVWLRGKADVVAVQGRSVVLFDWKTGKKREDPYELELQALMVNAALDVERIIGHAWLGDSLEFQLPYQPGAKRNWNPTDEVVRTPGGGTFIEPGLGYRTAQIPFDYLMLLDSDRLTDMAARLGFDKPVVWLPDMSSPWDTFRYGFLGQRRGTFEKTQRYARADTAVVDLEEITT